MVETRLAGSFRDPAGHIFTRDGVVHRRVLPAGLASYRQLMDSGLYKSLTDARLLIPHDELGHDPEQPDSVILRPQQVPLISYPYEWSLSQLRDAARVTLRAASLALKHGMILKDASAYNVQFVDGRAVLIDTLSYEAYSGGPWGAYRQFCQHFLAPLAVGATRDAGLVRLSALFIDGLPLPTASALLPRSSYLKAGSLLHIHLHARATAWNRKVDRGKGERERGDGRGNRRHLEALLDSLDRAIRGIVWANRSAWAQYYADAESYSSEAFASKAQIVRAWLERVRPTTVWDLGANTGYFTKLAASLGARVLALDADPVCVDMLYQSAREANHESVLPLLIDLANPSPGIGWANEERMSLESRGPADLLLALAVTHHLAIGNNVPFSAIGDYLARLGRQAIVEFVPKSDPMVQGMLQARRDVFDAYNQDAFERAVGERFTIVERVPVASTERSLYLLTRR